MRPPSRSPAFNPDIAHRACSMLQAVGKAKAKSKAKAKAKSKALMVASLGYTNTSLGGFLIMISLYKSLKDRFFGVEVAFVDIYGNGAHISRAGARDLTLLLPRASRVWGSAFGLDRAGYGKF